MELVKDISELQSFITYIKLQKKEYISNFFLSYEKQLLYIEEKLLYFIKLDNTVFLLLKLHDYFKVYYFSNDYESLKNDINKLQLKDDILICEIMGKHSLDKEKAMLESSGYMYYSSLVHMYKRTKALKKDIKLPANVIYAGKEDIDEIWQLLFEHFNKYVDINIIKKELVKFAEDKCVLISKDNGKIVAFCVYFIHKGKGEGRYLYIDETYKTTLLGVTFFSLMLQLLDTCQYVSGFVREDNQYLIDFNKTLKYEMGIIKCFIYAKVPENKYIEEIKPMNN